jgi:tRNA dimethylallyltransferase
VIVGATASGKSSLARELADLTGGRIISVDSRKIYRRLNIGSAKPTPEIIAQYDYAMIDLIEPHERYSAYQYAQAAIKVIEQTITSGKLPILAGGTGFYLRALKDGLFEGPASDPETRAEIRHEAEVIGWDKMFEKLRQIDPEAAANIDPHNIPRLERALEVYYLTGEPITSWQKAGPYHRPPWRFVLFGINRPRPELHQRIEIRTERMVEQGLIDEVESLLSSGVPTDAPGLRSVGYAEIIEYLSEELTRTQAIEKIKTNTRRYAKRQLTWFRHQETINWLNPEKNMTGQIRNTLR